MSERYVQKLLMEWLLHEKQHIGLIPNSTQTMFWEADMLSVTGAMLVHEFEIKCSRADYRNEFRSRAKQQKHRFLERRYNRGPNYFWFVTYGDWEIPEDLPIPDYAGHISINPHEDAWHYWTTVRQAPRLHPDKWTTEQVAKLARLLSYRLLKEYQRDEPPAVQNRLVFGEADERLVST